MDAASSLCPRRALRGLGSPRRRVPPPRLRFELFPYLEVWMGKKLKKQVIVFSLFGGTAEEADALLDAFAFVCDLTGLPYVATVKGKG